MNVSEFLEALQCTGGHPGQDVPPFDVKVAKAVELKSGVFSGKQPPPG